MNESALDAYLPQVDREGGTPMSKFDRIEKGTKLVITHEGARALSKWFKPGQIGYFEGFKSGSNDLIRVRLPGREDYKFYADTFWRVYTKQS